MVLLNHYIQSYASVNMISEGAAKLRLADSWGVSFPTLYRWLKDNRVVIIDNEPYKLLTGVV